MRRLDLTPLYKSSIGFDHLASMFDQLSDLEVESGFPPYNIERLGENTYRISMAVAGFGDADLSIGVNEGMLTVRGEKKADDKGGEYIHQGIAARNFERRFRLAEYVEVSGAALENGLLHIDLKRELPEIMKPRAIPITKGQTNVRSIEGDAQRVRESQAA
jgi:molecular chaperone IbpA